MTQHQFEKNLGDLGRDIDTLTEKGKEKYEKEIADLKHGWELLEHRRKVTSENAKESWDDIQDGMNEGLDNLKELYAKLKSRVRG